MRIAIFGAGAVGAYVGGRLAQAGEQVALIARGDHLDALRRHGLRVESPQGDFVIQPWLATDDPAQVGVVDVVVVGVKMWQLPDVADALSPLVGPQTSIVPLQNGVEAPTQLARAVGPQPVLGGCCWIMSGLVAPGHIRHRGGIDPYLVFGEMDNHRSARVDDLYHVLTRAGLTAAIAADIQVAMWEKLVQTAAFSGIGAVTRAPVGTLCHLPETRALLAQVMEEAAAVARARHIALPDDTVATAMAQLESFPPGGTNSTQRDLMAGRPSELEAHTGAVVRLGQEVGVPTPLNTFVYHSLLPQERRACGQIEFLS
jgi:2-dehydropantoate 2-reductase